MNNQSKMSNIKTISNQMLNDPAAALHVAYSTIIAGLLTAFDVFAHNAGVIASAFGIALTIVLIVVNMKTLKKTNLEIELLERRKSDKVKKEKAAD